MAGVEGYRSGRNPEKRGEISEQMEDRNTHSSRWIFKMCIGCSPGAKNTRRGTGVWGRRGTEGCAYRPHRPWASFNSLVCCVVFYLSVSKKLAPIPPKVPFGQPGPLTEQSAGQPSPLSLSPTPPSTPSPYGLGYPQGHSVASGQLSPAAAAPPLASPSAFTSTLSKSRPTPKPRQRPSLPPPQPPTVSLSASSPQSTEHPVLDGMSPGESMSTGNQIGRAHV